MHTQLHTQTLTDACDSRRDRDGYDVTALVEGVGGNGGDRGWPDGVGVRGVAAADVRGHTVEGVGGHNHLT